MSDRIIYMGTAIIMAWLIAFTCIIAVGIVKADTLDLVPDDTQVVRGNFDLRNSTVTHVFSPDGLNVQQFSLNDTYDEYVRFVGLMSFNLTIYEDRAYVDDEVIPTTDWYLNSTGEPLPYWLMVVNFTSQQIELYYSSASMPDDIADTVNPLNMITWYLNVWSVLAYGFMLVFPATIWLRFKSEGGAGISLLLISAVGVTVDASLLPVVTLICGVSLGTMIFRAWWMRRTGSD